MKKLISIILAVVIMATPIAVAAAQSIPDYDHNCLTDCKGNCEYSPLIVVPGIMQSSVYVQDENGNDLMTRAGFPIVEGMALQFMFDTQAIYDEIPSLLMALALSILKGDRDVFLDRFIEVFDSCFSSHYFNPDGTRTNPISLDEYWYSDEVAKTKPDKSYGYAQGFRTDENGKPLPSYKYEYEYDFIKAQVDITSYCEKAGYDHAYYFAYSSFGDTLETAERLNEYIQMVKQQTGHDKVSIVFISLGGTIGNAYLAKYCDHDDIDRIVFAAAASDGSYLLSDLVEASLSFDDSVHLYSEMLPLVMQLAGEDSEWLGYLLNFVTRAVPNSLFTDLLPYALDRAVKEVLHNLMINCPSMWALIPSAEYERLSQEYISDEAHAVLKAKTDEYYQIQKNAKQMLKDLTAEGMDIFVISGYNLAFPSVVEHWNLSSDNIIQAQSTSFGATFSNYGETLPDDYQPAIDESYISPEREVDAGTAALPDRTWFVRNQSHLKLQPSIKDVIALCVEIVTNKNITDSRVNNGGYAQFNSYRDSRALKNMIDLYDGARDAGRTDALDSAALEKADAAYDNAVAIYNKLEWDYDETKAAEIELYTQMYDNALFEDPDSYDSPFVKYQLYPTLKVVFKTASDIMMMCYGARDYYTCSIVYK